MEIALFIVTVVVFGGITYWRSQRPRKEGQNATDPNTVPDLNPAVQKLLDEGYTLNEAIEKAKKDGDL